MLITPSAWPLFDNIQLFAKPETLPATFPPKITSTFLGRLSAIADKKKAVFN